MFVEFATSRGETRRLGPYERLYFEGERLVSDPGGVIAKHADHEWHLTTGGTYTRLECLVPVEIHFSSDKNLRSNRLGPFGNFSSIDGVAFVDRQVFAVVDRQNGDWYSHELGTHWKVMAVEPASTLKR